MQARHIVAAMLSAALLAGCALPSGQGSYALPPSDAWLNQAEDCCNSLAALPTTALAPRQDLLLAFGSGTPVHVFATGKSPFHALTLPRQAGPLKLSWTSEVQRAADGTLTLFAPSVLLLDVQGNVQRRFDWRDFSYQPARGLNPDRLTLSFGVTPGDMADRVVVMTSAQALDTGTELLHPARAHARARNLVEPDVQNPIATHRASGRVALEVRPLGEVDGLLAPLIGSADTPLVAPRETVPTTAMPLVAPARVEDPLGDLDYRRLMRAALKAQDIALAMQLAERAERAGDKAAREWLAERLRVE